MKHCTEKWYRLSNAKLIKDEILEIGDGYRAKNSELDIEGLPFARAGNIKNGFLFDDADLLAKKSVEKAKEKVSRPGDCVITTKGTFGRVAFVRENTQQFVYSPQLCYWRSKDQETVHPRFLFYWLQGPDFLTQAYQVKSSTDMADYANLADQRSMSMFAPKVEVQQKIAATLSAYDDLIENNKRRIALLEKMAEEIYREWFVRFRFPGYQNTEFEKGIPKDWKRKKLKELCIIIKRGISPKYDDESDRFVINQKCIRDGRIDLGEARTHSSSVSEEKYIQYADALINSTGVGTLGRVSVVEFHPEKITVDSHVTICRANPEKVDPIYLTMTVAQLQSNFEFMAAGSTGQVELNKTLIEGVKVLVPDNKTMFEFREKMEPIFKQKQLLSKTNNLLNKTKNQLLPRLISGQVSVEDLDIQFPPSMLHDEVA